ncbi:riboflavin synthase [Companilactobacillus versmoldensis]|uniref:Riboflavin synthase n=1 Tax=Companilactobacillus versmoldensis DSM 14857 = KCTC 3814 TaxID=1423815 RepID=A0A0R1SM00_9LACO|nr:riboflavin synthase [Companilactobacillus versmoldensis]KRL67538.1 riboflavin synthase subunit alpha [Companilactobacillus versmoldensis DSM 14857 = KCTC 3814]
MFTGIIKDIGTVNEITPKGETFQLAIKLNNLKNKKIALGDSIAINGTCLTVISLIEQGFKVEAMPETFRRTNLGSLQVGDHVNIEPALAVNDKLDGHFVLGHVDTTAEVTNVVSDQNSVVLSFELEPKYRRYIVEKGSVAIDGVSLTVSGVTDTGFQVSLIPFTLQETILGELKTGNQVNIETDILGKYILDSKVEEYQHD